MDGSVFEAMFRNTVIVSSTVILSVTLSPVIGGRQKPTRMKVTIIVVGMIKLKM